MTKDKALQLALKTLKADRVWLETDAPTVIWEKNNEAITAINEALETKDEQWGSSLITNPEFVAEQKEKTQQLRNMVDAQNMTSKFTYKEQVETKDDPVPWEQFHEHMAGPNYVAPQRTWVELTDEDAQKLAAEHHDWESLYFAVQAKLKEKNT